MGWIYDLFHKEDDLKYLCADWEKLLCSIHTKMGEGAKTLREYIKGLDIQYPETRMRYLCENGYMKPYTYHGCERSFLITKEGIHKAKELKKFVGEDGQLLLGNHN